MPSDVDGASGSIAEFDAADSIGTLVLEDGTRVRFGATACKGFLPVVGARVRVVEAQPHPRHGLRAKRVELLDKAADHHARTAQTYGLKQPTTAEQRGSATLLGWVTVLLDSPLPTTDRELNELMRSVGLDDVRVLQEPSGNLQLACAGTTMQLYAVADAIRDRRLDLSQVGDDFPRGSAFVTLSLGTPDLARKMRKLNPKMTPPTTLLARVVAGLCRLGPGVALDLADGLVIPSEDFVSMCADTEQPERLWSALMLGHGDSYARSRGMGYFGSPDVAMRISPDDIDDKAAILAGVCRDMAQGWMPESGEILSYELGGRQQSYRMFELGSGWWLGDDDPAEGQAAHHAGVWLAASERLMMRRVAYVDGLENRAPQHYVDIYGGVGSAMITNGLSLAEQPGGTVDDGNARVELMCYLDRDDALHARMLSYIGGLMFDQAGDQPLRPWDGLHNGPDSGFPAELETMILVPREPLVIWPGHEPQLWQVVAVSADEYSQLRGNPQAGARWLEARKRANDWPTYHARFNALVS